jgi:predicted GNAT superfamily acetyltransferase
LDATRVEAAFARRPAVAHAVEERIVVPAATAQWKASEATREQALAVQSEIRQKFQQAFSRGWAAVNFSLDADQNGVYELGLLPLS